MPIVGKTRAQIKSDFLADLSSRMSGAGYASFSAQNIPLLVALAETLALDLEGLESNAQTVGDAIIPNANDAATLARHVAIDGVRTKPATQGVWGVTITGTVNAIVTFAAGRKLVSTNGNTYTPTISSAVLGSGSATIPVKADVAGVAPNLVDQQILTWTSPPTGVDPLGTAQGTSVFNVAGTDADAPGDTVARVIAWRRGRPASSSPPDWVYRAETIAAVRRAYCYPCLAANPGAYADANLDTLGSVTVVVLGPAQGDSPTSSVVIGGSPGAQPTAVRGYFLGTHDLNGTAATLPPQYPATIDPASVSIETPVLVTQNVEVALTPDAFNAYPWIGTMSVDASSTTTSLVVTGDLRAKNNTRSLVFVGTSKIRGGYQLVTLPAGSGFAGGKTTWDLTQTPLLAVPSLLVYPAPGNWEAFRLAWFAFFDGLGPGDVPDAITVAPARATRRRRRYPPQAWLGVADLYLTRNMSVSMSVPGTFSVAMVTPAGDQTALPKQLFTLGTLLAHA